MNLLHQSPMIAAPSFVSGLELARTLYAEHVAPILRTDFPSLEYAAALIGPGSEVLGFDTATSTDHDWRPRVFIFLKADDFAALSSKLEAALSRRIPGSFRGFPTRADNTADLRSRVVYSVDAFWREYLGICASENPSPVDWLTCSEHRLLGLTKGVVFTDLTGELTAARAQFRYYPEDIRLYLAAAEWSHIAQEEAFMGRAGDVGDEIGSRLIAARLVRHLMRLCFILEREYCPYSKWFGAAFAKLDCASKVTPLIEVLLEQSVWTEREGKLSALYLAVAELFAQHGLLGGELDLTVRQFHARPYQVIEAERFATYLRAAISSAAVRQLAARIGSVEQFIDSHEIQNRNDMREALRSLYYV